ncbi:MAG: RagB/SusD family nutrient uptake outer membrane protein [Odoribacteraceae bacterium]|jgi:hypothetical protein|nr:RagB/SusD family nutrient uptake outer membrane protein [Odoribacteraceae bacterium]
MNKLNKIKTATLAAFALVVASCNSWLEVQPDDRIMSEDLFKDRAGFLVALNGVYASLNSPYLYGGHLTAGMIDVMGQYYDCSSMSGQGNGHDLSDFRGYSYVMTKPKELIDSVWRKSYKLIGDCNVIIERCGEGNPVLPDNYYRLIKGEAIALRAWLHLDLLRFFGPVWSLKEESAIPYVRSSDRAVQPLLTGEQALALVIEDLTEASTLLSTVDPVLTDGPKNYPGEAIANGNDWNYRQHRLNYFAVRLVLARAYLWGGNKTEAGKVARDVIARANNPERRFFPLTGVGLQGLVEDRIFSREVFFALYNTSRTEMIYNKFFAPTLSANSVLAMFANTSERLPYTYDDQNDYRYKMWSPVVINGLKFSLSSKYGESGPFHLIPLIRLSEAYLIAAECEEDVALAITNYLNPLRLARNCRNVTATTPEELTKLIDAEYLREFVGEGQFFYYLKRNERLAIPDGAKANATRTITRVQYKVPLPESETNPRV